MFIFMKIIFLRQRLRTQTDFLRRLNMFFKRLISLLFFSFVSLMVLYFCYYSCNNNLKNDNLIQLFFFALNFQWLYFKNCNKIQCHSPIVGINLISINTFYIIFKNITFFVLNQTRMNSHLVYIVQNLKIFMVAQLVE